MKDKDASLRLAVDIGGTFTDTVLASANGYVLATAKTPTTHANPTDGAMEGIRVVLAKQGTDIRDIVGFIHGTTLATNALIERRGAKTACITSGGFRDILEIAYERRHSQYDINIDKPDLIVPRSRCFTIPERVTVSGDVLTPLDESEIDSLIDELDECEAEAVAICLLHSYANPDHENRLREVIKQQRPNISVSVSSEVSPEAREFDRLCTTIANAYIQPMMNSYLHDLADRLAHEGMKCPALLMTASGGMTTIETAAKFPIRLVESGPAGGAILAARVARQVDAKQTLSFDMGGTTAKLCLIDEFRPQTARKFEISRASRFIKGSGIPVRIPVLEMIEIGAGGGSIASVDRLGRLQVGPQSAGSEPGPAAFCKGGNDATVTDADFMLGYIDPSGFAEGKIKLDRIAAINALESCVGEDLGLEAAHAAFGISDIVDESMASAGRMHAVESGKVLSERLMIAFGGNGPLHATRVARRCGISAILIPPDPSVGSAAGFLFAPVSFEIVRSRYALLDELDIEAQNSFFEAMSKEATQVVRAGAPSGELLERRTAYMRYHGQGHEIEISLPNRALVASDISLLRQAFETEYSRQFTRSVPGMKIEILNWAISLSTRTKKPESAVRTVPATRPEPSKYRMIICDKTGEEIEAAVFSRHELGPGCLIEGPALIGEPQTTTLVSVDFSASIDAFNNILLSRKNFEGDLI